MPIKMIASRRHYDKADDKEYAAGESFYAADDREADKLVRMKRAQRANEKQSPKSQTQSSTIKTRAVTAEAPSLALAEPASSMVASEQPSEQRRFYKRRDLTPEV